MNTEEIERKIRLRIKQNEERSKALKRLLEKLEEQFEAQKRQRIKTD